MQQDACDVTSAVDGEQLKELCAAQKLTQGE
jgi:hypothetical protein